MKFVLHWKAGPGLTDMGSEPETREIDKQVSTLFEFTKIEPNNQIYLII